MRKTFLSYRACGEKESRMNKVIRTLSLLKIAFHSHQIRRYRLQGRKLMSSTGQITPQLIALNQRIDHHGCLLYQLERNFER